MVKVKETRRILCWSLFFCVCLSHLVLAADYEEVLITDYQSYAGTVMVDGQSEIDWAPAIQEAVDDGKLPFFPQGIYYLNDTIDFTDGTGIRGESREAVFFRVVHQGDNFKFTGSCLFENFQIEYPEQTLTSTPIVHGPAFEGYEGTGGIMPNGTVIRNIHLRNAYDGIFCGGSVEFNNGTIENIVGFPYRYGVYIDTARNGLSVRNVHLNPNIQGWDTYDQGGANLTMLNWVRSNGTAFYFGEVETGTVSDTFCFGYRRAYHLAAGSDPSGYASGLDFIGCSSDGCERHIWAFGNVGFRFFGGAFATFHPAYNGTESPNYTAIYIDEYCGPIVFSGVTSHRSMGQMAIIKSPAKLIGCVFSDAFAAGYSTWAKEAVYFSDNADGSSLIGCTVEIASVVTSSKSVRIAADGVILSHNVYDSENSTDVYIDSGYTAEVDGHGIGTTTGRSNMLINNSRRNGYLYYDTTLGKMIMYKNNGWYNLDGSSL